MAKVRVYELAKELGVDSKVALKKLNAMGEFVRSASSTVEPPVAKRLRDAFASQAPAKKLAGGPPAGAKPAPRPKPAAKPAAQAPAATPAPAAPAPPAATPCRSGNASCTAWASGNRYNQGNIRQSSGANCPH